MLIKVNKFIFPTVFIVLDMEEDKEILIIHGIPFLATRRALKLQLMVQEEEVTFNVFKATKHLDDEGYGIPLTPKISWLRRLVKSITEKPHSSLTHQKET